MGRRKSDDLTLPPGIEIHGKTLRIVFRYKGVRCRETLGIAPTNKNIKYAEGLRATVLHEIRMNTFRYHERFPDSPRLLLFENHIDRIEKISLKSLREKYLRSRGVDLFHSSLNTISSVLNVVIPFLGGEDKVVCTLRPSDIDTLRADLKEGRMDSTVNGMLKVLRSFFIFARRHRYTEFELDQECRYIKSGAKDDIPDPLEKDEFEAIIHACKQDFYKHLFAFAVYTGLRAGEIVSLCWHDVDLKSGTLIVRRNLTRHGFKLTKNYKSRSIELLPPALDALKRMRLLTALMPETDIEVYQRDKSIKKKARVRFVFNPLCYWSGRKNEVRNPWLLTGTISGYWRNTLKKAGVRHRRFHQTRHTYACWALAASGNPSFVADQMGHKDLSMLINVYAKWMPSKSTNEASRIWSRMVSDSELSPIGDAENE